MNKNIGRLKCTTRRQERLHVKNSKPKGTSMSVAWMQYQINKYGSEKYLKVQTNDLTRLPCISGETFRTTVRKVSESFVQQKELSKKENESKFKRVWTELRKRRS